MTNTFDVEIEEVADGVAQGLKCNPEIFQKGSSIAYLDVRCAPAENWVRKVAKLSEQRVDWHYSGGVANVLFLGNSAGRARVVDAIRKLAHRLDGTIMRILEEEGPGLYRRGVTETPPGAIAGFLDPISGEQSFIVKE